MFLSFNAATQLARMTVVFKLFQTLFPPYSMTKRKKQSSQIANYVYAVEKNNTYPARGCSQPVFLPDKVIWSLLPIENR